MSAGSPAEAYSLLAVESVDAILLDLNFSRAQISGEEGLACLREIRRHNPDAVVLVVTGHSGLTVAVQALRSGASNFIMKPWSNERLLEALEEALSQTRPAGKAEVGPSGTGPIVGACDAVVRVRELVARYAPLTASVLISGETGTGKSLAAQALHRQSGRAGLVSCEATSLDVAGLGGLTDTTLVIENIDRLPAQANLPLLSWLQGAGRGNCRVVATTVFAATETGLDRGLSYALSTLEILMPPLHDRGNDIELLAEHFGRVFAMSQGLAFRPLSPDAAAALKGVRWQDNLHALRRAVERATVMAAGPVIAPTDLDLPDADAGPSEDLSLERTEKFMIEEALKRHNFNVSKAAVDLGLTRQALYRRMARHGF
jgi:DNA-binding NtrC family response regulator